MKLAFQLLKTNHIPCIVQLTRNSTSYDPMNRIDININPRRIIDSTDICTSHTLLLTAIAGDTPTKHRVQFGKARKCFNVETNKVHHPVSETHAELLFSLRSFIFKQIYAVFNIKLKLKNHYK
jgi:hypothetical protein